MSAAPLVMMLAGGTGGHVYPALAVAEELRERGYRVEWGGTRRGLEARVVPAAGIALHCLAVRGLRGKSLQFLATTCMAATIEQLSDGSCTVEVQPEQLEAIIERHGENVPAGTRTAVRELRLFLNAAHKETEMPVCAAGSQTVAVELAAEDEKKRVAEEESEKEGGAFGRQLRVFLRKLHFVEGRDLVEHTMQFYIGKYEAIQASVEASDLSWPARAFAAMEIAARAKEGLGLREHSSRMRPALLASLGATSVAVMELVQELYDRLNTGSSADHACA